MRRTGPASIRDAVRPGQRGGALDRLWEARDERCSWLPLLGSEAPKWANCPFGVSASRAFNSSDPSQTWGKLEFAGTQNGSQRRTCTLAADQRLATRLIISEATLEAPANKRYGLSERTTLGAEMDETLNDRPDYRLDRSMKFLDGKACGEMLQVECANPALVRLRAEQLSARHWWFEELS